MSTAVKMFRVLRFFVQTIFFMWVAHGIAFFVHEYSHSVVAWMLGWKTGPLDLHFPPLSVTVLLIQLGINQNVDNGPIFASGHGLQAAIIAAAGPVLGNGMITYSLGRLLLRHGVLRQRKLVVLLGFWIVAASIGNFIDYVPIRTFTGSEDDMGVLATGLRWSPWLLLTVLGIPTALATIQFMVWLMPSTLSQLYRNSSAANYGVAVLSTLAIFGFYGSAGFLEGDSISFRMSLLSVFAAAPIATLVAVTRVRHYRAERAALD